MTDEIKSYDVETDCTTKSDVNLGCGECECGKKAERCDSDINEEELQEIYRNAVLGKTSVEIIRPMSKDRGFRDLLTKQYSGYDNISKKMEDYAVSIGVELKDPTGFAKGMMYCTTMVNTVKDRTSSKLAEIMIQGINMGIISLTKISNRLEGEGKSNEFVDEMSDLLQEYLAQTKAYL